MKSLFDECLSPRPGYRLARLELFNWGTFDSTGGTVYRFQPDGQTTLLVGHNGSGKSTLVDALLTLLVPGMQRTYNVAAGGHRRERSEASYVRGAWGQGTDDSDQAVTRYLRGSGNQPAALMGVFHEEDLDKTFTLLQILRLGPDGSIDKDFAIIDEARELHRDLAGLTSSRSIGHHFKMHGYEVSRKFVDYERWFRRRTKVRPKAMEMFNQVVFVKDIHSLNEFIRRHMLESHNWQERIDLLLTHFRDLETAHLELLAAQRAEELLLPIETSGLEYQKHQQAQRLVDNQLAAAETFFAVETQRLLEPELELIAKRRLSLTTRRNRLTEELADAQETVRQLQNEIERSTGERLRQLPWRIKAEQKEADRRQARRAEFQECLHRCKLTTRPTDETAFRAIHQGLAQLKTELAQTLAAATEQQHQLIGRCHPQHEQLREERQELEALRRRRNNLPEAFATIRGQICAALGVETAELPFAAELLAVRADEQNWLPAIEMLLHGFALNLLVPKHLRRIVAEYANNTRIADQAGRGQRLRYTVIAETQSDDAQQSDDAEPAPRNHGLASFQSQQRHDPLALFGKIEFKPNHRFVPWVKAELRKRFNYRCCETLEQLNETQNYALTVNRLIRHGHNRHEKDDRHGTVDPRQFVLGWNNREKILRLAESIQERERQLTAAEAAVQQLTGQCEQLRGQQQAAAQALAIGDFAEIDAAQSLKHVDALEAEKRILEGQNDAVKRLRDRLKTTRLEVEALQDERDSTLTQDAGLGRDWHAFKARQQAANAEIDRARQNDQFDRHAAQFAALTEEFAATPLNSENLTERQMTWSRAAAARREEHHQQVTKFSSQVVSAMQRYLSQVAGDHSDLSAQVDSLPGFLSRLQQIRRDDLPRHRQSFKERLNDKVTQEIALLNNALRREAGEIVNKIKALNGTLRELEYRPGTYMQLEPLDRSNAEISDFKRLLTGCLTDSLNASAVANESRFARIEKFVHRLSDPQQRSWRDRVIDVRQWYDFAACEHDSGSHKTLARYHNSSGQSGGEKAKLAFTILVAAIAYQYDLEPTHRTPGHFQFVVVDEMFSKVDDRYAEYALELFRQFGLQLLIVAPLDSKARVTEPYADCFLHVVKDESTGFSNLYSMTTTQYEEVVRTHVKGNTTDLA